MKKNQTKEQSRGCKLIAIVLAWCLALTLLPINILAVGDGQREEENEIQQTEKMEKSAKWKDASQGKAEVALFADLNEQCLRLCYDLILVDSGETVRITEEVKAQLEAVAEERAAAEAKPRVQLFTGKSGLQDAAAYLQEEKARAAYQTITEIDGQGYLRIPVIVCYQQAENDAVKNDLQQMAEDGAHIVLIAAAADEKTENSSVQSKSLLAEIIMPADSRIVAEDQAELENALKTLVEQLPTMAAVIEETIATQWLLDIDTAKDLGWQMIGEQWSKKAPSSDEKKQPLEQTRTFLAGSGVIGPDEIDYSKAVYLITETKKMDEKTSLRAVRLDNSADGEVSLTLPLILKESQRSQGGETAISPADAPATAILWASAEEEVQRLEAEPVSLFHDAPWEESAPVSAAKWVGSEANWSTSGKTIFTGDVIEVKLGNIKTSRDNTDVTIVETVPAGMEYQPSSWSVRMEGAEDIAPTFSAEQETLTWEFAKLPAGASLSLTYTLLAKPEAQTSSIELPAAKLTIGEQTGETNKVELSVAGVSQLITCLEDTVAQPLTAGDTMRCYIRWRNESELSQATVLRVEIPPGATLVPDSQIVTIDGKQRPAISYDTAQTETAVYWDVREVRPGSSGLISFELQSQMKTDLADAQGENHWQLEVKPYIFEGSALEKPDITSLQDAVELNSESIWTEGEPLVAVVEQAAAVALSEEVATAGTEMTIYLTYRNETEQAQPVTIQGDIPSHTKYIPDSLEVYQGQSGYDEKLRPEGGALVKSDRYTAGEPDSARLEVSLDSVAAGAEGYIKYTVQVQDTALRADSLRAVGQITLGETQRTTNAVSVPLGSLMSSDWQSADEALVLGESLTYTIIIKNNTSQTVENASAILLLPSEVSVVNINHGGSQAENMISWMNLGALAAGESRAVSVQVQLHQILESDRLEARGFLLTDNNTNHVKPQPPADSSTGWTPKTEAAPWQQTNTVGSLCSKHMGQSFGAHKLSSEHEGEKSSGVSVGDTITYTVNWKNTEETAVDILLTIPVPAGSEYLTYQYGGKGAAEITVTEPGAKAAEFTAAIAAQPQTAGWISFDVRVLSSAAALESIICRAELRETRGEETVQYTAVVQDTLGTLQRQTAVGSVQPGDRIDYILRFENDSEETADITLSGLLPSGTAYVDGVTQVYAGDVSSRKPWDGNIAFTIESERRQSTGALCWVLKDVQPGQQGWISFQLYVGEDALAQEKVELYLAQQVGGALPRTSNIIAVPVVKAMKAAQYKEANSGKGIAAGESITYTITYKNESGTAVDMLTLEDAVPDHTRYQKGSARLDVLSGTAEKTTLWEENGVFVWQAEGLSEDAVLQASFDVVVEASAPTAESAIAAPAANYIVDGEAKQTNELTTPLGALQAFADTAAVTVGDSITYTIDWRYEPTAESAQKEYATVVIKNDIPKGTKYLEGSATQKGQWQPQQETPQGDPAAGALYNSGSVVWNLQVPAAEPANGSVSFQVEVESAWVSQIENRATVTIDGQRAIGTNGVIIPVTRSSVQIEKSDINSEVPELLEIGDRITYTMAVQNTGQDGAQMRMMQEIPKGLQYISGTARISSADGEAIQGTKIAPVMNGNVVAAITWDTASVPKDGWCYLRFTVEVTEEAMQQESIAVQMEIEADGKPVSAAPLTLAVAPMRAQAQEIAVGQQQSYTIRYHNDKGQADIVYLLDYLPYGTELVAVDAQHEAYSYRLTEQAEIRALLQGFGLNYRSDKNTNGILLWVIPVAPGEEGQVTATVKVLERALPLGEIENQAEQKLGENAPQTAINKLKTPISNKVSKYEGKNEKSAACGISTDLPVTYTIWWSKRAEEIATVIDFIPQNTAYEEATAGSPGTFLTSQEIMQLEGYEDIAHLDQGNGAVIWSIDSEKTRGNVSYTVRVTEKPESAIVESTAAIRLDEGKWQQTNTVQDPWKGASIFTNEQSRGRAVGDELRCALTYLNEAATPQTATLIEAIPENTVFGGYVSGNGYHYTNATPGYDSAYDTYGAGYLLWELENVPAGREESVSFNLLRTHSVNILYKMERSISVTQTAAVVDAMLSVENRGD